MNFNKEFNPHGFQDRPSVDSNLQLFIRVQSADFVSPFARFPTVLALDPAGFLPLPPPAPGRARPLVLITRG